MKSETAQPTDLAQPQLFALIEKLLPVGYSLTRTRYAWYLKQWGSWVDVRAGCARMSWREVDSDPRLEALLGRIADAT